MDKIGWFFFDLLLLGYVEDKATGTSFHVPGELGLTVFAEVSNVCSMSEDCFKFFSISGTYNRSSHGTKGSTQTV